MTAEMTREIRKASVSSAVVAAVVKPETTGITARAARLDVRAMALFTPEAMLTWSGLTDPITVAVSGATNDTSPRPKTRAPGSTSVTQDASGPMRASRSSPSRGEQRTDGELQPRADPLGERARPGGEHEHEHRGGQQCGAGLECRPSGADLQLVRDQEERDADRGVQQHGREVGDGELAAAEQRTAARADRARASIR